MVNKSIKKLILGSLVIVIPAQTMPLAVLSFSSIQNNASQFVSTMKETIRKHKTVVAVAVGSCIATCACAFRLKNQKTTSAVALGGFIATGLSKIYCDWKKTTNMQAIEGIRARANQGGASKKK